MENGILQEEKKLRGLAEDAKKEALKELNKRRETVDK